MIPFFLLGWLADSNNAKGRYFPEYLFECPEYSSWCQGFGIMDIFARNADVRLDPEIME